MCALTHRVELLFEWVGKRFFFEKKKQKTFDFLSVVYSNKELLPCGSMDTEFHLDSRSR